MNPFGYHLTSLLLHSMSAVLVYFISSDLLRLAFPISPKSSSSQKRLGASDLRTADIFSLNASAAIAALIFSVHPLRTETVAWVAARGHLLSGLFFLSSVGCYVRAVTNTKTESGRRFYLAAVICYGLSLLSQPGTVSLPFICS
jgi:protein O-mannosyl-transferase